MNYWHQNLNQSHFNHSWLITFYCTKMCLKVFIFFKLNFYTQFYNFKKLRQHTQLTVELDGWSGLQILAYKKKKKKVQNGPAAHTASHFVGTGALPPGKTRLGCEAGHIPPTSAEGKNGCIHMSSAVYAFMAYIRVDLTFKNWLSISIDEFVRPPFIIN